MEIFPTSLRNTCLTVAATVSAGFSMVGPFVVDLVRDKIISLFFIFLVFLGSN